MAEGEFRKLTLPQFWLLWQRRMAEFRRQCYLQGLTASAVYNVSRTEKKQHVFSPFDFVPRNADAEKERRDEIVLTFKRLYADLRPHQIPEAKTAWANRLAELGRADVEEIIAEIFGKEKQGN